MHLWNKFCLHVQPFISACVYSFITKESSVNKCLYFQCTIMLYMIFLKSWWILLIYRHCTFLRITFGLMSKLTFMYHYLCNYLSCFPIFTAANCIILKVHCDLYLVSRMTPRSWIFLFLWCVRNEGRFLEFLCAFGYFLCWLNFLTKTDVSMLHISLASND